VRANLHTYVDYTDACSEASSTTDYIRTAHIYYLIGQPYGPAWASPVSSRVPRKGATPWSFSAAPSAPANRGPTVLPPLSSPLFNRRPNQTATSTKKDHQQHSQGWRVWRLHPRLSLSATRDRWALIKVYMQPNLSQRSVALCPVQHSRDANGQWGVLAPQPYTSQLLGYLSLPGSYAALRCPWGQASRASTFGQAGNQNWNTPSADGANERQLQLTASGPKLLANPHPTVAAPGRRAIQSFSGTSDPWTLGPPSWDPDNHSIQWEACTKLPRSKSPGSSYVPGLFASPSQSERAAFAIRPQRSLASILYRSRSSTPASASRVVNALSLRSNWRWIPGLDWTAGYLAACLAHCGVLW